MKTLIGALVVVSIVVGGFFAFSLLSPQTAQAPATDDTIPTSNEYIEVTSLSQSLGVRLVPTTLRQASLSTYSTQTVRW